MINHIFKVMQMFAFFGEMMDASLHPVKWFWAIMLGIGVVVYILMQPMAYLIYWFACFSYRYKYYIGSFDNRDDYLNWCRENKIKCVDTELFRDLLFNDPNNERWGCFRFKREEDVMAFKLRWC